MTENRFALALQAAGAGLTGRGPEFQQMLAGRRQAESESQNKQLLARQRAFAEDNRGLAMFLEQGDLTSARELVVNRQRDLQNFPDADTSDTEGALADIDSGNIEDLLRRSRALDQKAVIANVLPARDKPKQQIVDGQLVTINAGGARASDIEGLRQGGGSAVKSVQSSDILPDGTVIKVFKSGLTEVSDPQGNVITGQQRADKIRESREFGAEIQGKRSRERTLGSEIAKTSIEVGGAAFKKLPVIRGNIANLDKVISAIDRGAKSGAVERFLPSVRAASVELDNLRNQLGLDVIGDVTFGALSKGELDLALDTALPTGLDELELKAWAESKRSAQTNVLKELRKTAKFFSLGGTITEYLILQEKMSGQSGQGGSTQPAQAQRLRFNPETGAIE